MKRRTLTRTAAGVAFVAAMTLGVSAPAWAVRTTPYTQTFVQKSNCLNHLAQEKAFFQREGTYLTDTGCYDLTVDGKQRYRYTIWRNL